MKPIGFVSVDSGLLLFADPCHVLTETEYDRIVIKDDDGNVVRLVIEFDRKKGDDEE